MNCIVSSTCSTSHHACGSVVYHYVMWRKHFLHADCPADTLPILSPSGPPEEFGKGKCNAVTTCSAAYDDGLKWMKLVHLIVHLTCINQMVLYRYVNVTLYAVVYSNAVHSDYEHHSPAAAVEGRGRFVVCGCSLEGWSGRPNSSVTPESQNDYISS